MKWLFWPFYFISNILAAFPWNTTAVFKGFATWQAWPSVQTSSFQDSIMDASCAAKYPGTKAAFQQQVLSQLISDLPAVNTAGYAVLLKCYRCEVNPTDENACFQSNYLGDDAPAPIHLDCFGRPQVTAIDGVARRCVLPVPEESKTTGSIPPSRKWPIQYYNLFDNCFSNTTRAAMCVLPNQARVVPIVHGQCVGNCMKKIGYCFCDNVCINNGDCCPGFSFQLECDAPPPLIPSFITAPVCENKCGQKVGFCHCDQECSVHGDCCAGFSFELQCRPPTPKVNASSVLFPLSPKISSPFENLPLPLSVCVNHCGEKVGYCHCDSECDTHGDCCPYFSFALHCQREVLLPPIPLDESVISDSCRNNCAGFTGSCWCDGECQNSDDCCADIDKFCG